MFTGFPTTALDFYEDLEADNSKVFWASHRSVYDTDVRAPMVALLDELESEFGSGKVFRPYRDVRFSKDKTPYKTHQGGVVETCPGVGFYVQIDASGLFVAGGSYSFTPNQLARYRAAVDDDRRGRALQQIVRALERSGYDIGGARLRTRPRGADPAHPRLDLLRHRTLSAGAHLGCPDWLDSVEAADRVRGAWRTLRPLLDWFADALA